MKMNNLSEINNYEDVNLDLDSYVNSYTGLARIYRLTFMSDHCLALRTETLQMAVAYAKLVNNVRFYQILHKILQDVLIQNNDYLPNTTDGDPINDEMRIDQAWIDEMTEKGILKLEQLETDIRNNESKRMNECIRRSYEKLGDHYLEYGDLNYAFNSYIQANSYCNSPRQIVDVCFNVIKTNIYIQNWDLVLKYVHKAEQIFDFTEERDTNLMIITKLKCASGIVHLSLKSYKLAADDFLQASFNHCQYPEVLSPNDVALYGGLCALATYDRNELKKKVLLSSSFKEFLELELELRDMIVMFCEFKYSACLKLFDEIKNKLCLDMYLCPNLFTLYSLIRNRTYIEYFSPYSSIEMTKMAATFDINISTLENELIELILNGQIHARIDSCNKVLYAKYIDHRKTVFERSLIVGKHLMKSTQMMMLRAVIKDHQIQVTQ